MTATTERPISSLEVLIGEAKKEFDADTIDHRLAAVLHDDGLYRHMRFRAPKSRFYWFDIITWPGGLTIGGDVEYWTFRRDEDMLAFFRSNPDRRHPGLWGTSPDYWAEKLVTGRDSAKVYDPDLFKRNVREDIAEFAADLDDEERASFVSCVEHYVLDDEVTPWEETARQAVADFSWPYLSPTPRFSFYETYEWSWHTYSTHFLWACHALVWAIDQYDASMARRDVPVAPPLAGDA